MPLLTRRAGARSFYARVHRRSSFSAPTKFVPLSDQFFDRIPRLAMNHSTPMTQELESIDGTTSIWMALVVDSAIVEGRLAVSKTLNWQIRHERGDGFQLSLPAVFTIKFNVTEQ